MASNVVDFDECSGAVEWPERCDCEVVGPTLIVGDLMGRRN